MNFTETLHTWKKRSKIKSNARELTMHEYRFVLSLIPDHIETLI